MASKTLPSIAAGEASLSRYLEEIRRFPMLQPQEEYMLAKRFLEHERFARSASSRDVAPASRCQDRHGVSWIRIADWRSHFGR